MSTNFYFIDKNDFEKKIITDVLNENDVKYKVITKHEILYFEEDIDDKEYVEEHIVSHDIMLINISLEMFDYIKYLVDKRASLVVKLNKCLKKRIKKQKEKKKIKGDKK